MNRIHALGLAILLPGVLHAQRTSEFAVAAKPITTIGAPDAPVDDQLLNVTGARRLSDGRVVVANGKPLELRMYSAAGKLLMRIGRKGQGPGEFRGKLDLLAAGGDSVLVYDQDNLRLTLFSPDGKLVHEWTARDTTGSPRGQSVLYRRTLVQGITPQQSGCIRPLLDALTPLAPPALREVYADGAGRFWAHAGGSEAWMVYAADARPLGGVHLPKRYDVYQVGDRFVVGRVTLDDETEEVRVLGVTAPPTRTRPGCMGRRDSFPATDSPRALMLKVVLRSAMTGMEMFYSNYASYPTTVDSMQEFKAKLPRDMVARVLAGDRFGYAIMAFDRNSTLTCAFRAGRSPGLVGWPDMAVRCIM